MNDYKLTVIYSGNEPINRKDGEMEYIGSKQEYDYHSAAIYSYIKENYTNTKEFENIKPNLYVESAAYALTRMGSIIFINTTPSTEKALEQYGHMGLLMIPNTLSDNQKNSLIELLNHLNEYNIEILYDLNQSEGILDGKTMRKNRDLSSDTIVNFISNIGSIKQK